MKKLGYKMLILTDHSQHSDQNSIYELAQALKKHSLCEHLAVASRGVDLNKMFFDGQFGDQLWVREVTDSFQYHPQGKSYTWNMKKQNIHFYDVILLRLPPPLPESFLQFLGNKFRKQYIINDPEGIHKTGSKAFLSNFKNLCPPMKRCNSWEDIVQFKQNFPIVLKPLNAYGGKGLIRIEDNLVWRGKEMIPYELFKETYLENPQPYLAMKFLKNVHQGDKRILVVDGHILGATLRLPPKDSWLCNAALGGASVPAKITLEEEQIVRQINKVLSQEGILMYGVDTLMGDNGKRVLSEINTTSIGGLIQLQKLNGQAVVAKTANLIWLNVQKKLSDSYVLKN